MARLVTSGAELRATSNAAGQSRLDPDGIINGSIGNMGLETTVVRSGSASFKGLVSSNTDAVWQEFEFAAITNGIDAFARAYFRFDQLPATACDILTFTTTANALLGSCRITSGGKLQLWNNQSNAQVGSDSALTVAVDKWYRVQLRCNMNVSAGSNDTLELRVLEDGMSLSSEEIVAVSTAEPIGTTQVGRLRAGYGTAASPAPGTASITAFVDDVAVNDGTGTDQSSWPGEGKIVLLKPISDNARSAGMTNGTGGTTNLWDAVDNAPPVGVASGSATATSQIKDAANNATDNYDANLQSYTTAGVPANARVMLAYAVCNKGNSTTTSRNAGLAMVSNPAIAEATGATGTTAAAGWPTGWTWMKTAYSYLPAPTLGTSPVLRLGKRTASTNVLMFDSAGLYVEYALQSDVPRNFYNSRMYLHGR